MQQHRVKNNNINNMPIAYLRADVHREKGGGEGEIENLFLSSSSNKLSVLASAGRILCFGMRFRTPN